jgi:hypothetical protein
MLQLHSASDDAISYLQNFAHKRNQRNHVKKDTDIGDDLHIKIISLEQKLALYESHKENAMVKILELLGT